VNRTDSRKQGTRLNAYRVAAGCYDWVVEPLNLGLRSFVLKVSSPAPDMKVLDVGCGTGAQLIEFQKAGCAVFGIDPSPHMLEKARARLGRRAVLCLGDGTRLPFADGAFERIVISMVLHETSPETQSAVVGEVGRVVKKDGRILIVDYHPGPLQFPKGHFWKALTWFLEFLVGGEHYDNYLKFQANKCARPLADRHHLAVEKEIVLSGGNLSVLVLRASGPVGEP
jgi:ubiquinone/menaquinone biosynthesis C-methylase UbiE